MMAFSSSPMKAIHQFVAGFTEGDAISNEARVMRDLFTSWGYASRIFCEARRIPSELAKEAEDTSVCVKSVGPDDVVLLHLSIGSPVNDVFTQLSCRKAILYHNVTPPDFFKGIQEQTRNNLRRGREQVAQLAGAADVNMADSAYNAGEIEELGYKDVKVLPLVLKLDRLTESSCGKTLRKYDDGKTNILFVGRCAPNKRLEDLVSAFYYYQNYVDTESRFIHVGSFAGTERYKAVLQTHARDLRLNDFNFVGSARQPVLNACYRSAHVFLCM
ncbi:MAG: glycosyltransferase, partial [Verrucomicrobiota bacterium]